MPSIGLLILSIVFRLKVGGNQKNLKVDGAAHRPLSQSYLAVKY